MHKYKRMKVNGKCIDEHRLVVEQAIGRKLLSTEIVHHKDGNKLNNAIENLEIMSRSEHARLHTAGRHLAQETKEKIGEANKNRDYSSFSKLVGKFSKDGILLETFASTKEAQRQGYCSGHIARCCNGIRKTHKGFIWKYISEAQANMN